MSDPVTPALSTEELRKQKSDALLAFDDLVGGSTDELIVALKKWRDTLATGIAVAHTAGVDSGVTIALVASAVKRTQELNDDLFNGIVR